jgi:adenosylmethionine-8-amino-7-oxononanoate aminotransferase
MQKSIENQITMFASLRLLKVHEIAEVLRDLHLLKAEKELSFGEKKIMDMAKTLLVKELAIAKDVKELIETTTSRHPAAFIAEPIQGVGGFVTPPKEYFKEVVSIVKNMGNLFAHRGDSISGDPCNRS